MKYEWREKELALEDIEERASKMYIEGHPPTPRWWLDRIGELHDQLRDTL